jgi:uncharacterized protein with HEPN domain
MHEDEIVDILDLIVESIKLIRERFSTIKLADNLILTAEGVTLLDAICMRLQVIGESVKQIQKIDQPFLEKYSEIEWDKIARFRDLVSHHYEHVDHEVVYDICKTHIPKLGEVIEGMHKALSEGR